MRTITARNLQNGANIDHDCTFGTLELLCLCMQS